MKRILFLILIFTGAIFAQSRFYYGDLEVAGDLDVDGASNLTGNITTLGTLSRPTSNYGLGLSVAGYITVGYIGISTPNQYPYMGIDSTLNTISFESDIFAVVSNTVTFSGDTVVIEGGLSIGSNATVASGLDVTGDLDVDGSVEIGEVLQLNLHTVAVGDSVLGRIFIDAADTTLKAGTGSDLVVIKDLAP